MLEITTNVTVRLLGPDSKILAKRHVHNVTTNNGRKFFRNMLATKNTLVEPYAENSVGLLQPLIDHRPAFIGVGVGGALQTYSYWGVYEENSGKYPVFQEVSTVTGLEAPVAIKANPTTNYDWLWVKAVEAQTTQEYFPDDYTLVLKTKLLPTEVSFDEQVADFDRTFVPVSEAGLFSSEMNPYLYAPAPGNYVTNSGPGYRLVMKDGTTYTWPNGQSYFPAYTGEALIAYAVFPPIPKTDQTTVEIVWELKL